MRELERFLKSPTPPLLKIALAHVQLELICLLLGSTGLMKEPLLYVSTYLKAHRREYYDRLQAVRTDGDWEGWVRFFLEGLAVTADDAWETARRVLARFEKDRRALSGASAGVYEIFEALKRRPIASVGQLSAQTGLSWPAVSTALGRMPFVKELTGGRRNRIFTYSPYVTLLSDGDTPLR